MKLMTSERNKWNLDRLSRGLRGGMAARGIMGGKGGIGEF